MTDGQSVTGWRFLALWVLLTAVGYAVGFLVGFVLGHLVLGNVSVGIGIGAVTGLMQWLLLRRRIERSTMWILANVIGLTLFLGLYGIAQLLWGIPFDLGWPWGVLGWGTAFLLGGALAGVMQQRILRRRTDRAAGWVVVSAVGWALSVFAFTIPPTGPGTGSTVYVVFRNGLAAPAVAGIILGLVTGIGLVRILGRPRQQD